MTNEPRHPIPGQPDAVHTSTSPSPADNTRGRVVVGVDGSPESRLALARARELAEQSGAVLEPLISWQHPPLPAAFVISDWSPERDCANVLRECLAEQFGDAVPDWVHPWIESGPAAHDLIEASRGAELLVVGSRGHGGFAGLLLGSVSSACAEYAHCPVLVVRETTR